MSLILDALRKMEQDRKNRRQNAVDIRPEVTRYRRPYRQRQRNRLLPVTVGIIIFSAGLAGGLLLWTDRLGPVEQPQRPGTAAVSLPEKQTVPPPLPPDVPATLVVSPPPARPDSPGTLPTAASPGKVHAEKPPADPQQTTSNTGITISGIAWQEERSLRRAVINGALVGEGTDVAGTRVMEIMVNRVRFSRGSQTFEVAYPSALPSR